MALPHGKLKAALKDTKSGAVPAPGSWSLFCLVLILYSAGLALAWYGFGAGFNPSFFPAAGLTVSAMLLTSRSHWPTIVLAIVVGQAVLDALFQQPWWAIAGFSVANVLEPLVGASLTLALNRGPLDLRRRRGLLVFLCGACMAGPLVGAVIGGATMARKDGEPAVEDMLRWWAGDALGVLVVAVPILLWFKQNHVLKARPLEMAAVLLATGAATFVGFRNEFQPSMLVLPVLAMAAFRLDMLGAALASAVMAVVANIVTRGNLSAIAGEQLGPDASMALGQARIAVWAVLVLVIAQESSGRMHAIRQREAERRERLRLRSLSDLAQRLSAAMTPDDVGEALLEHVVNESGATAVNLGLVSTNRSALRWVAMHGHAPQVLAEVGDGIPLNAPTASTDAIRTGTPVIVRSVADYAQRYGATLPWWKLNGVRSLASWPLTGGGEPVGVLTLMWSEAQPLDSVQQSYLSAVATMVSQALARARIYADERAKAAVLQSAVLPSVPGDLTGIEVSVAYEPSNAAEGVGGDWYDVMALEKGRTYIAVGDVMGHGLPAVEDMAQLRIAGRALALSGLSPARLLAELNLYAHLATHGRFATMAIALFDPASSTLSYAVAGHPPPLLRRSATGGVVEIDDAHGPLLGPMRDVNFTDGQLRIDSDDVLVMYTDGLVERPGVDLTTGISRCARAVEQWRVDELSHESCVALAGALAPPQRQDDVCVVAVRFGGGTGS